MLYMLYPTSARSRIMIAPSRQGVACGLIVFEASAAKANPTATTTLAVSVNRKLGDVGFLHEFLTSPSICRQDRNLAPSRKNSGTRAVRWSIVENTAQEYHQLHRSSLC